MQTNSIPKKLPVPFADSGSKQEIPTQSQIGVTGGRASYTDGFPPLTRTPLSAGGIPPFGTDFNGVLNDITNSIRWQNTGSNYPFDADFVASIAGYPKGAVIPSSIYDGYWLNTTEANSVNPEATNGSLTGWVPLDVYGVTTVAGLAASSVTMTNLQAAKDTIKLTGSLTSNINLVVPAWVKSWTVINNCTGSFSVTVKTPAGTGVAIPAGKRAAVSGDGINITDQGFLRTDNNLSEIAAAGTAAQLAARGNLALDTAATRAVGTGANQLPDMSSFSTGLTAFGYFKLPSGIILQWRTLTIATATAGTMRTSSSGWAVPFPNACLATLASLANVTSYNTNSTPVVSSYGDVSGFTVGSGYTSSSSNVTILGIGY